MAHRKSWSSSRRIKQHFRNQARREFNAYWRRTHPPAQNTGCLIPVAVFVSGVAGFITAGAYLIANL